MAYRNLADNAKPSIAPRAPRKRFPSTERKDTTELISEKDINSVKDKKLACHPLTNQAINNKLKEYELNIKSRFDRIVPCLKKISKFNYEKSFIDKCQKLALEELGFELPEHILEKAWIQPLDMRGLFAWCVFQSHQELSKEFYCSDPLSGSEKSSESKSFNDFLLSCGFHLLDITPCSDGRLAHTIAYALRIPFSSVRRRSHAGALFDVEKTVNRWIKTEHRRYLEGMPNASSSLTRYLKVVTYHFSSLDSLNQGCAAHGSDDALAASEGLRRLKAFREAVEKSFCCGSSVDLLLIGIDTDTDEIRVHVPSADSTIDLTSWISSLEIYKKTYSLGSEKALQLITQSVLTAAPSKPDDGMVNFIVKLVSNNISQIDYVRQLHGTSYPDAGHAERFIGVGIGFKEVHLRNLTYFSHLDTVEKGAPDLDVGVKIFKGLNVSRDLPIPIVIRFDYSGRVPGARDRAIADCRRVDDSIASRYRDLVAEGLLHTFLTIRDRDNKGPAEVVGSSLDPSSKEAH